jgi:hypothetical protein
MLLLGAAFAAACASSKPKPCPVDPRWGETKWNECDKGESK